MAENALVGIGRPRRKLGRNPAGSHQFQPDGIHLRQVLGQADGVKNVQPAYPLGGGKGQQSNLGEPQS